MSDEHECPVCFQEFGSSNTESERYVFPCGHSVCKTCDARMRRVSDNRCPKCREPREGFTPETAQRPAERESNRTVWSDEMLRIVAHASAAFVRGHSEEGRRSSSGAPSVEVMIFRSEADPVDLLHNVPGGRGEERRDDPDERDGGDAERSRPARPRLPHSSIATGGPPGLAAVMHSLLNPDTVDSASFHDHARRMLSSSTTDTERRQETSPARRPGPVLRQSRPSADTQIIPGSALRESRPNRPSRLPGPVRRQRASSIPPRSPVPRPARSGRR